MASLQQAGWRTLQGMSIVLLCLLEVLPAWAQNTEEQQHLPLLNGPEASRLLLNQPPLEYPALAKVNYIQGRVRVELKVSPTGEVASAHVLSGQALLAAAVLDSVRMWRYHPLVAKGVSTAFSTVIDVKYTLQTRQLRITPRQAESDFRRQVKPPEVLTGPEKTTKPSVRLRLLVSAEGKVLDSQILEGIPTLLERARKHIMRWSFRPARWGALSVPWYLDVDVPIDEGSAQASVDLPSGR